MSASLSASHAEPVAQISAPSMQQELRVAARMLSRRGLRAASRWAAELRCGAAVGAGAPSLPSESASASAGASAAADAADVAAEDDAGFALAKACFDCGEFGRAAALLDRTVAAGGGAGASASPPPLPPLFFFLRCYALYLDGERLKQAERADRVPGAPSSPANPHLPALALVLGERARAGGLDAFGQYMCAAVRAWSGGRSWRRRDGR